MRNLRGKLTHGSDLAAGDPLGPARSVVRRQGRFDGAAGRAYKRHRLLPICTTDAAEYTIHRDASRREKVELRREPVYVWTNPDTALLDYLVKGAKTF